MARLLPFSPRRLTLAGLAVWWLLAAVGMLPAQSSVGAEGISSAPATPLVTNIAQLRALVGNEWRVRCDLQLEGVVGGVSLPKQALVLVDSSGAELLALGFGGQPIAVGDRVSLVGKNCEVTRRREGLALGRAPLLMNDGRHGPAQVATAVELAAGWHPIRVEWFNSSQAALLQLSHAEPGGELELIPDSVLARSKGGELGLNFSAYEGGWAVLPDFGRLPRKSSGTASNFDVTLRSRDEYAGLVFDGWFEARVPGRHTFRLRSDDGSRLFLGAESPVLTVLGKAPFPAFRQYFIGQVVGNADVYVWARAYGDVRRVELREGLMELELRSPREGRLVVEIVDGQGVPPALLMNNRVSINGVSRKVMVPGGQLVFGLVTTASADQLELVEVSAEVWAANPPRRISELPEATACPPEGIVLRLQGRLGPGGEGGMLVLQDPTGTITLLPEAAPVDALIGRDVETLAHCQVVNGEWVMRRGFFRAAPVASGSSPFELPLLTTAEEILRLKPAEAGQARPARLRGAITCLWPQDFANAVIQDGTRGIFLQLPETAALGGLQVGDFWEVEGATATGDFAPILKVSRLTRLAEGRLPEPVRPSWDQLINGSLDVQYVEIEGIIIRVVGDTATLLTSWGRVDVSVTGRMPLPLEQYENRLVRLRGCLLATWDLVSGQLRVGEIRLGGASITTDEMALIDPFGVPLKTLGELRRFDIQAGIFQRVRIAGQLLGRRDNHLFLGTPEGGCRVITRAANGIREGDLLEIAGFPQIDGPAPVLHEAVVRKTGSASMPVPRRLGPGNLLNEDNDALLVRTEAILLSQRGSPSGSAVLELQSGLRTFAAHTTFPADRLRTLRPGSRLELTGVYLGQPNRHAGNLKVETFELVVDSPAGVRVLALPPWWTLQRLLLVLAVLLVVLAGAMLWVFQLRRRVEFQTAIIRQKVRQEATLEERTRIARELHDTLEQALAGVSFQLGALAGAVRDFPGEARHLLERAQLMVRHGQAEARRTVRNLRMLDSEGCDLPGALERMMKELARGEVLKTELRVQGTPAPLPGTMENHLLRIGQEAITNALKHGGARNIRLDLNYSDGFVELAASDDGRGFDPAGISAMEAGHFGILGMRERTNKIGGALSIVSAPAHGTTVKVRAPLSQSTPLAERT